MCRVPCAAQPRPEEELDRDDVRDRLIPVIPHADRGDERWREVAPARCDVPLEDLFPVFPDLPRSEVGGVVDLDRHDFGHRPALEENNSSADAARAATALLAARDVLDDERIRVLRKVRARDEVGALEGETEWCVRLVLDLDEYGLIVDVARVVLELEGLVRSPCKQRRVRGAEFAQVLGHVWGRILAGFLVDLRARCVHSGRCETADSLVGVPVCALALLGAVLDKFAACTDREDAARDGGLDTSAAVALTLAHVWDWYGGLDGRVLEDGVRHDFG